MAIPWSIAPANSSDVFLIDDGNPQETAFYSRGILTSTRTLPKRQIISYVVAHNPGERRTNSRDVAREVAFSGHIWGNPEQSEYALHRNIDALFQAFRRGTQQLCVLPDGRYWNAELESINPKLVEGDVWHCEYDATFYAADPYAYGTTVAETVVSNLALASFGSLQWGYSWLAAPPDTLGSESSPATITVQLVAAHGAYAVQILNESVSPAAGTMVVKSPFADGDTITLDSANAQATVTPNVRNATAVKSSLPVYPILLDPTVAAPTGIAVFVYAAGGTAPVVTIAQSWQERYL